MEVEITTVSKHREKLTTAPAAVFSLNADDVQRAAVKTLPDALRLVPGVQVARVGAHDWAISARGFTDVFANKLLVLRDGRSVYTPLFSGVYWDEQDLMLEDLERIEVVRGPGASLWGANAVNGVINILSKPARETQGSLASVTAGSDPQFSASARHGAAIDADTHFRFYGKYTRYDDAPLRGGGSADDDWHSSQVGFRIDRQGGVGNIMTLQGDAHRGRSRQTFLLPAAASPFVMPLRSDNTSDGANILARVTQRTPAGHELMVQGYFDYTGHDLAIFGETRRTFDLEAQQSLVAGSQQLTLGAGFRTTADRVRNTPYVTLNPSHRRTNLWSAFVQDDIALARELHLIIGSKLERNDFTGWEVQPSARLLWTLNDRNTVWLSAARAVRTPSRAEDDVIIRQITSFPGVSALSFGDRRFESEELAAFEAGWRTRIRDKISLDVAVFANNYRRLRTSEVTPASLPALLAILAPVPTRLTAPLTLAASPANLLSGETYGGEIALAAQLAPGWRVRASYSHLRMALHRAVASLDFFSELDEDRSPRHQGSLWSQHDFGGGWRFDGVLRAVDRVRTTAVPGYLTLDARLAWRPAAAWEIAVAGRNLLGRRHPEFLPDTIFTPPTEIARSVYLETKYEF